MSVKAKGFEELKRKCEQLGKKEGKSAMRKAMRAGATVMKKAVKASTPVDKGVLRRAQDYKVTSKGTRFGAFIGANVAKLEEAHQADPGRPSNIDWLVEYGHVTPEGVFVRPSGHMRRAADEAMPMAEARIVEVLASEIEKAAG